MRIVRGYTDKGTFGAWYDDSGAFICHSMERPWLNNSPFTSCVPEGTYGLEPYHSSKFGDTYALVNHDLGVGILEGESDRYAILIHSANWVEQLQGCIAPGTDLTVLNGKWAISASRNALKKIIELIDGGESQLIITHKEGVLDDTGSA